MSKQYLDKEGLQVIANKVNKKISTVITMPENASGGTVVLYKGEDSEQYSWGHIYESFDTMLYAWKDSENYVVYTDTETPQNGSELYATSNGQPATSENRPELVPVHVTSYDSANSTITDSDDYTYTRESSLDFDNIYWDDITATVSGLKPTDSIPNQAKPGTAYLYIGLGTSHEYGHIYYTDGNERYYAWGYEFRPDEWGYDYTLTPNPQVGDTTVNGGEITAVAPDYSTITINGRYWMRFSNRDYDNARWIDTTPIEVPTYDLINTGTATEPVFDWIQICDNIKSADFSARVHRPFFKLYGRGYGSGTSTYDLSYFGIYSRRHTGATGPDDSLIEEFTIYAGTKFVVVHYDMSDRTWSYEESSIGADEQARETAAGAIGLAQSVSEKMSNKIGYLGKELEYNIYDWTHVRTVEEADTNHDITITKDGWYSIDYTLTSNTDVQHTFTLRDFDAQGEVHTIMRFAYDRAGTFRQTFLVPLKAGTYRYSHGGIGTLSVYMNRREML